MCRLGKLEYNFLYFIYAVAVIFCFLICWTPYHIQRMLYVFVAKTNYQNPKIVQIQEALHLASG